MIARQLAEWFLGGFVFGTPFVLIGGRYGGIYGAIGGAVLGYLALRAFGGLRVDAEAKRPA